MSKLVKIVGRKVPPMFYKKRPVVTFRQVDELHQRKANSAMQSFNRHRDKLIEGKDLRLSSRQLNKWKQPNCSIYQRIMRNAKCLST